MTDLLERGAELHGSVGIDLDLAPEDTNAVYDTIFKYEEQFAGLALDSHMNPEPAQEQISLGETTEEAHHAFLSLEAGALAVYAANSPKLAEAPQRSYKPYKRKFIDSNIYKKVEMWRGTHSVAYKKDDKVPHIVESGAVLNPRVFSE